MLPLVILVLIGLPDITKETIELFNTEDRLSIEFYDCFTYNNIDYCRRPTNPIELHRENLNDICYNHGTAYSFEDLALKNISSRFLLLSWNIPMEIVEEYSKYLIDSSNKNRYLCQCVNERSFGKNCEYLLPQESLPKTINWMVDLRYYFLYEGLLNSDILCYTTLVCDSGLLCLDWRDICDGIQQCMFGYDEENCDKLEFNECEQDEYRCMNGMCIPDGYFLDGEYDCLDLSDEMKFYDDTDCFYSLSTFTCDDRICPRMTWSCGDGQCISNRFAFQNIQDAYGAQLPPMCKSERDQYFMCETNDLFYQWTLPNGKCYHSQNSHDVILNRNTSSLDDECEFFIKCALSLGAANDCPDFATIENPCNSTDFFQYPKGAVHTPYTFFLYNITREWTGLTSDYLLINGTIKCRGYTVTHVLILPYDSLTFSWNTIEHLLCNSLLNNATNTNFTQGYDRFCSNDSLTFSNKAYNYFDICKSSRECISTYRIRDGYIDCADEFDENFKAILPFDTCLQIKRHRFRCSINELTCLPIIRIGNDIVDCQNKYDEFIKETYTFLSKMKCRSDTKIDCTLIRQYIEESWTIDYDIGVFEQKYLRKIPFHAYCDGFWDLHLQGDENILMCQTQWICHEEQWQCKTGQCIYKHWVLDRTWDCADGSDEEAILFSNVTNSSHNRKLMKRESYQEMFSQYYLNQPMTDLCNPFIEFPCVRIDTPSNIGNLGHDQLCISLSKLGDGTIDCLGGLDERNTVTYCDNLTMLGNYYKCSTSNTCIYLKNLCDIRCPNTSDDELTCFGKGKSDDCSEPTTDFMCLNNECAKNGWCDDVPDCPYGEDEFMCYRNSQGSFYLAEKEVYRTNKLLFIDNWLNSLDVRIDELYESERIINIQADILLAYTCNRGIAVSMFNESIVCFCPHQYYGDKCQFHSDRIVVTFQLNMMGTIYEDCTDPSVILKLVVMFLFENQTIDTYEFPVVPINEKPLSRKNIHYFLYSRSNESLNHKRMRYFNRSNIIHEHPYAIQINAYELKTNEKPKLIAVWRYSIYFDYLPNFQLAKILHLYNPNLSRNPCSTNPCHVNQQCYPILNKKSDHICLCHDSYQGPDCLQRNSMCLNNFCSSKAICDINYPRLIKTNRQPYCICPKNTFGARCHFNRDPCSFHRCLNNRSCFSNGKIHEYFCTCGEHRDSVSCQLYNVTLYISFRHSIEHRGAVIQHQILRRAADADYNIRQYSYYKLPERIELFTAYEPYVSNYSNLKHKQEIITVKLFSSIDKQFEYYLIYIGFLENYVNATVYLNDKTRIVHVDTLFKNKNGNHLFERKNWIEFFYFIEISPYKYHSLCIKNRNLRYFHDSIYFCICVNNNTRAECFLYEHDIAYCESCLRNGLCLKQQLHLSNKFICICPRCYYGHRCQFSTNSLSLTFDLLIIYNQFAIKLVYSICILVIFCIGSLTNYATFVTCKRPKLYKTSVGTYLLTLSIFSQLSLFALLLKINYTIFISILLDIPCKLTSYLLSITTRYTYWLTSLITIDRLRITLFPSSIGLIKTHKTIAIILLTLIIIIGTHIHEILFYVAMKDSNDFPICTTKYTHEIEVYNRVNVLIHYMVPFCIQVISVTLLIISTARSRSRVVDKAKYRNKFIDQFKQQFQVHRELYLTPIIIIISSIPHIIFSFSFACMDLSVLQRHILLITYLLSYTPQTLGFVVFILPSSTYSNEFQQTKLAKYSIFRWMLRVLRVRLN